MTSSQQIMTALTTPEDVDAFLSEYPTAGIFKAGTCHKTMQGFSVLETFLKRYELPLGVIRVVEWRPASNHVASLTGSEATFGNSSSDVGLSPPRSLQRPNRSA